MLLENNMCLYEIPCAPYIAVSSVYHTSSAGCLIEDTSGDLKRVKPIYVGPFDHVKLKKFGEVLLEYFRRSSTMKMSEVHKRAHEIFNY